MISGSGCNRHSICIRVDGSWHMGFGHMMRCLVLAEALREYGYPVVFICHDLPGNPNQLARDRGFRVFLLPRSRNNNDHYAEQWQDARETIAILEAIPPCYCLVVDHYHLDRCWEESVAPYTNKLIVIDDLANRPHYCHLLLDQNLVQNMKQRYSGLVPDSCRCFLGPCHALLRPEFIKAAVHARNRDGRVGNILVSLGGTDPGGVTVRAVQGLALLNRHDITVHVAAGCPMRTRSFLQRLCQEYGMIFHGRTETMAQLISEVDLGIGAGGISMWERCLLGLPSICVIMADNQKAIVETAAGFEAVQNLGWHEQVTPLDIKESVAALLQAPGQLRRMEQRSRDIMKGWDCGRTLLAAIMEE